VTRRRGRRRKKLLDDLKDSRGYCRLKEEALDRSMWRNRFRGGFGPVVRQNTEWMNTHYTIHTQRHFYLKKTALYTTHTKMWRKYISRHYFRPFPFECSKPVSCA